MKRIKYLKELISDDGFTQIVKTTRLRDNEVKCPKCRHIFVCGDSNKFQEVMLHMVTEHPDDFFKGILSLH